MCQALHSPCPWGAEGFLERDRPLLLLTRASLVTQQERIRLPRQETQVRSLGREDALEEKMATHSSILACKIPWREEPGGLQTMGSQKSWTRLTQQQLHEV